MLSEAIHAWLAHIAPHYPSGIPKECIKAPQPADVPSVRVAFVLDRDYLSDDPESVLLDAAIIKGLRMEVGDTVRGTMESALPPARVVVRLTGRQPYAGRALIETHRLSEICRDTTAKREFWEDLKSILEYLGRES